MSKNIKIMQKGIRQEDVSLVMKSLKGISKDDTSLKEILPNIIVVLRNKRFLKEIKKKNKEEISKTLSAYHEIKGNMAYYVLICCNFITFFDSSKEIEQYLLKIEKFIERNDNNE